MSETHTESTDDRAQQAAAQGAEGGRHRGSAASTEENLPPHGKHRRADAG